MRNDSNSIEELNLLCNESEKIYNEASKDCINNIGVLFM